MFSPWTFLNQLCVHTCPSPGTLKQCCWALVFFPGHTNVVLGDLKRNFVSRIVFSIVAYPVLERRRSSRNLKDRDQMKCSIYSQNKMLIINFVFVWFDSLRAINNISVIKGRVFLGWTSTKPGLTILLKDTTQWRRWGSNPRPLGLNANTLPLSHCAPISYMAGQVSRLIYTRQAA